jgi:nucleolar protein 16
MKSNPSDENDFEGFDDGQVEDDSLRIVPTGATRIQSTLVEVRLEKDGFGETKVVHESFKCENPLNDPLIDILSDEENDHENLTNWGPLGYVGSAQGPKRGVVGQLEVLAESGERKGPRKPSVREAEWIERLVSKHGDDFRAMSRDVKLNPMQQSEGDIRRRVKKWTQTK